MQTLKEVEKEIERQHRLLEAVKRSERAAAGSCDILLRIMLLRRIREEEREWEAYDQEVVAKLKSNV